MKTFHLTIARVDGPVYDAEAVSVTAPGSEGEFTVLAAHEPFVSALVSGTITVRRGDETVESFESDGGTIEVGKDAVSILL